MNRTTTPLFLTLGTLAGIMGIEHGIGEVLQGYRPTESVLILSWPNSAFFEIMSGEPAMTVIPNYLVTGLFAILFSGAFLFVLLKPGFDNRAVAFLFALVFLMLLAGGGFGPPILGAIVALIALKRNSRLKTWRRLPAKCHRVLGAAWPWSFGLCLIGWLMLFPGAALIAFLTGMHSALLMVIPMLVAFVFIPVTLLSGFSRDIWRGRSDLPKPA